jgi:endonuclease-8
MPEGHTIHRIARLQRGRLTGGPVVAWSPQGRFEADAERIDGHRITSVEAHGKHLVHHFDHDVLLHIHLGLFGLFPLHEGDPPAPSPNARLVLRGPGGEAQLSGPTVCELIDDDRWTEIRNGLGPDPLHHPPDGVEVLAERLTRRSVPIGRALLDQKVIAGLGNVYRAEVLYLAGIRPTRRADRLSALEVEAVWTLATAQLTRGEAAGRIVTVDPVDVGAPAGTDLGGDERLYVYKREEHPCHRCGTEIVSRMLADRRVWWCPTCQPD